MRRVPRGWAGKGPAAKPQIIRSAIYALIASNLSRQPRSHDLEMPGERHEQWVARCGWRTQ
ncbi:hypothetical protein C7T87_19430 [Xanthomonas hortorum pv. hederae]|nr:hypothetical protein C7T87_19430 [Xanthomonas hortorum pv. hederae]